MSHFCTLVILDACAIDEVRDRVGELLEPYNENTAVDEYDRQCHCIGHTASMHARRAADGACGTVDSLRKRFWAEVDALVPADLTGRERCDKREEIANTLDWQSWIRDHQAAYRAAYRAAFEAHPDKDKPRADCTDCEGKGTYRSTYNPKSKWDWWQIGGRWTGVTAKDYDPAKDSENFEPCPRCGNTHRADCTACEGTGRALKWPTQWREFDGDIAPIATIPEDYAPFAIVTPDGAWHENGRVGWWGVVHDEEEDWPTKSREILEQYRDGPYLVAVCDLHI